MLLSASDSDSDSQQDAVCKCKSSVQGMVCVVTVEAI